MPKKRFGRLLRGGRVDELMGDAFSGVYPETRDETAAVPIRKKDPIPDRKIEFGE
ncbi:MAG TPA: hypothetical protein HPP81_12730 [Deltaproteobacteria bacterium]|jgi:hypothetical protein|nr:hypothetical protein [Deltaproteobacteria bacterium]